MRRILLSVLVVAFISPVYAQETEGIIPDDGQISLPDSYYSPPPKKVGVKKPWLAFLLSTAIVGGGQFYNEQMGKGSAMFLGAATGIGLFYATRNDNYRKKLTGEHLDPDENDGKGNLGLGLALGFVVWSMVDAPVSAIKINERNQQAMTIGPMIEGDKVGVVLSLNFD